MRYLLTIIISVFFVNSAIAQCPLGSAAGVSFDMTPSAVGNSTTHNTLWGNEYVKVDVTTGDVFEFSTCDSPPGFNARLTVFNAASTSTSIAFNEDYCGNAPRISYTATFDGTVYVQLDQSSCTANASNNHLKVTHVSEAAACTDPDLPTLTAESSTICSGGSTRISVTGGSLNDATAWHWYTGSCGGTSVGTGDSINVSPSATTTYYARGEGGCVTPGSCATATVTVTTVAAAAVVDSNATCNGATTGGATASATGGTAPYTYLWSNSATTASITGVAAGTYTVTITDANSCTDNTSVTITQPAALNAATVVDSNATCNGFSDGGASASASGGTAPYTYLWSNAATTSSISGLAAGNYSVTITDANGCTDNSSVTITQPTALSAAAVVDSNTTCNGATDGGATASATGGTAPYTYLWSNAATTASITGVAAGTYTVTITDANGCTDNTSATITQPTSLVAASVVDSNATCNGATDGGATASATGGTAPYTYLWSNAATTASITGVAAGTYTVTITDANGCTDNTSATITQPTALSAAAVVDSNASCSGITDGGATASATGGTMPYTYLWSNAATTASITGVAGGSYSVTITDANGCTDTTSVTITETSTLNASAVVDSNATCNGLSDGGATASISGGTAPYSYLWSNAATTASITGVLAGNYSVTITDANGCSDNASVTITEPAVLNAATVVDSNTTCNGATDGGATAAATGGTMPYTYLWSNAATTASITGVAAGSYSVTITDANGCTDTSSVTITEPAVLSAATVVDSNISCNGATDGGATAAAAGGTMPYSYIWSNAATTASITGVAAGTYTVYITDTNGCTDTSSVTITEPATLSAAAVVDSNTTCNGFLDGGATASATGGTMPYTYLWSNSATTASITGVAAGTYTVTITDANSCTDTSSVTITEPAVLSAATVVDSNTTCNGATDGGATAAATGGTMPYTYLWSNAATTASITGVAAGNYSVTITDANGCTDTSSVTITEPVILTAATVVDSNITCNGATDGGATAAATGGTMPYTYLWSNAATTASITGVAAGSYSVTITDANGCTDTSSVTITEPAILNAAAVVDSNVTCYGFSNGEATASATGGTMPYSYIWSNGATTSTITGLAVGNYTVFITDANGCMDTDTVNIILANPLEDAGFAFSDTAYCAGEANPMPVITGTTGGTFSSSPSGLSIDPSSGQINLASSNAGTYNVTYTTPNPSCWVDSTVSVTINAEDDPSFSYEFGSYCLSFSDPTPVISGTYGGVFSSMPAGLTMDSLTGHIDLSASSVGQYVVQYTTPGICPNIGLDTLHIMNDTTDVPIEISGPGLKTDSLSDATYRWLSCDTMYNTYSIIAGETSHMLMRDTSQSGSYAVEVTRPGCIDTSECLQINFFTLTESFDTLTAPTYTRLAPDNFFVTFAEVKPQVDYQLLNKYGIVLQSGQEFNVDEIVVDMSPYGTGEYFLDVHIGKYVFRVRVFR